MHDAFSSIPKAGFVVALCARTQVWNTPFTSEVAENYADMQHAAYMLENNEKVARHDNFIEPSVMV